MAAAVSAELVAETLMFAAPVAVTPIRVGWLTMLTWAAGRNPDCHVGLTTTNCVWACRLASGAEIDHVMVGVGGRTVTSAKEPPKLRRAACIAMAGS